MCMSSTKQTFSRTQPGQTIRVRSLDPIEPGSNNDTLFRRSDSETHHVDCGSLLKRSPVVTVESITALPRKRIDGRSTPLLVTFTTGEVACVSSNQRVEVVA